MKLLLLQLGDIHLRSADDVVLGRVPKLIDAVKNLCPEARAIVCVLAGDIAFSGADAEYLLAIDFVDSLRKGLEAQHAPCEVSFVMVPGNHDLDHSTPSSARDLILSEIEKAPAKLFDASFSAIALAPLKNCFLFFEANGISRQHQDRETGGRLYVQHAISVGPHQVLFHCMNTAALSRLHESPGQLIFPTEMIPQPAAAPALSVAVMHHPYNWLEPQNARALRGCIEAISDIVLTGHEHAIDRRTVSTDGGENLYLEGGVLQDGQDPAHSQFHAIQVDLEQRRQKVLAFSWNGETYKPAQGDDPVQYHQWEDLLQSRLRRRKTFQPTVAFADFLEDPGLSLFHRKKAQLRLSDFYVYPDVRHYSSGGIKSGRVVTGDAVAETLSALPCVLLLGDDNSGKSTFAKRFFSHLLAKGDIPIWIDLSETRLRPHRLEEDLETRVVAIYGPDALSTYRQTERGKRVVIIDNYHRLAESGQKRRELLGSLRSNSFRVFATANEMELTLHEVADGQEATDAELPFEYYSILPFSVSRRNALVERWLLIGGEMDAGAVRFVQTLEKINNIIQTLVGKNYVPAFPPYVLAVLQATEAGTEVDLSASTHGYLYELFIKTAIAKHATTADYHNICEYLAHVAYWMSCRRRKEIPERDLQALHGHLQGRFEVLPPLDRLVMQFLKTQMMVRRNDAYEFRHNYIFYYFLAYYLRDHIAQTDVIEQITAMAGCLHDEDHANTLLFLSHLSKDRLILRLMLQAAAAQYHSLPEARLSEDVRFLNDFRGSVEQLSLPDQPHGSARRKYLEEMDGAERTENEAEPYTGPSEQLTEANPIERLSAALKTIQILGQILKNFPLNLEIKEKDAIMTAVTGLGRRALSDLFGITARNRLELLSYLSNIIAKKRHDLTPRELTERAAATLVMITEMAVFGMIVRITYSIGSERLTASYDRYFAEQPEPVMRLVHTSLHLDHFEHFPETLVKELAAAMHGNPLVFCLLRQLVVRHFHIFPADYRLKQRLGEMLKIDYQSISVPRKERQLIRN
ncbi:MAG: metallophosphoesterase [Opitutaceae bacterium]|nr:metallophosphoesterase [Opitutaceae bacterium]